MVHFEMSVDTLPSECFITNSLTLKCILAETVKYFAIIPEPLMHGSSRHSVTTKTYQYYIGDMYRFANFGRPATCSNIPRTVSI